MSYKTRNLRKAVAMNNVNGAPPPAPEPQEIPIGPTPMRTMLREWSPDGKHRFIVMGIETVVGGPFSFFYEPENAEQIGRAMIQLAQKAKTGLIVP